MDYEYLDAIALDVRNGDTERLGTLSTGERLYAVLAASRCELLGTDSVAYAISRIGPEAVEALIERHRYD